VKVVWHGFTNNYSNEIAWKTGKIKKTAPERMSRANCITGQAATNIMITGSRIPNGRKPIRLRRTKKIAIWTITGTPKKTILPDRERLPSFIVEGCKCLFGGNVPRALFDSPE
jgi:hypothetical protein